MKFILVDANPDCVACLRESAKLYPASDLTVFHAAAAEAAGKIAFTFDIAVSGHGHVVPSNAPGMKSISVPAFPLDSLFESNGITRIGLMKVDIEGSELAAMKSLSKMLSSHLVNFIYFEVSPDNAKRMGVDLRLLFDEFTRHGYRLFWPHDNADWILQTYGGDEVKSTDLQSFTIAGHEPYRVAAFDQEFYRNGQFGQCDLLAVSPDYCPMPAAANAG